MGLVNVTTISSTTETITKTKLNGLAANLLTEFNGFIDDDNIEAAAGIALSKLATSGTLTATAVRIDDSNSEINEDGSGNMTFKDAVTGTKTLAQLATGAGGGSNTYTTTFDNDDLSSGILTVTHSLTAQYVQAVVYDNNDIVVFPDNVTGTNDTTTTIDLSSYGSISGTWNVRINA